MIPQNLLDLAPELVSELQQLLSREGEQVLANQVARLAIADRCRCGDDFCATFYTAPRPAGSYGPNHRTIALVPAQGMLSVDVVGNDIVAIEALYRDDLKAKIHVAMP
ncbi:hypothetical protein [Limobrevibacterium gyesilva]|uniref:hypothetical protein n=1 Tax=Limobrevibacterium gyesilva TaxID=2991712 RepID=UPI002227B035|nr:hypothetical protein [Limobrevibacterium gyesilva]